MPDVYFLFARNWLTWPSWRIFREGKQLEATKLLLLSHANTFQHKVLLQYSKEIARQAEVAAKKNRKMVNNSDEEEKFDEMPKWSMF